MNAVVVGYGSIGARHARILKELGLAVSVVSRRKIAFAPHFYSLNEALGAQKTGYVVIANQTSEHAETLRALTRRGYSGAVLVEKPLLSKIEKIPFSSKRIYVGYQLRFHPAIQKIRKRIASEKICSVSAYTGSYLPAWRKRDYQKSYSSKKASGGGALRDLSHELDYLVWLLGSWERLVALGGRFGSLKGDSDDVFCLLFSTARCPAVSLQMNYLDRVHKRELIVNTDKHSYHTNLVLGSLAIDGHIKKFKVEPDALYRLEHQAILARDEKTVCSYREGYETLRMIESAERSARLGRWVRP